jgi:hypothetical protein
MVSTCSSTGSRWLSEIALWLVTLLVETFSQFVAPSSLLSDLGKEPWCVPGLGDLYYSLA